MAHLSTTNITPRTVRNSLTSRLAQVPRFYLGGDGIDNTIIHALVDSNEIVEINGFYQTNDLLNGYIFRNGYFQVDSNPPVSYPNRFINRIYQPNYDNDTYEVWSEAGTWSDIEAEQLYQGTPFDLSLEGEAGEFPFYDLEDEQLYNGPTPLNLSLEGESGDPLESDGVRNTDLHAYVENQVLKNSRDIITGSFSRFSSAFFVFPSEPPISFPDAYAGLPYYPAQGGTYRDRGPVKGRY